MVTGGAMDEVWTDVLALGDGSVVAVGAFPGGGGGGRVALAKFQPNGRRDGAFGRKGIRYTNLDPADEPPEAMVKIGSFYYVVGSLGSSPNMDMFIARFDGSNGRLDQSYASGGLRRIDIGDNDEAFTLHRTPDGGIAIGGTSQAPGFVMALAKVNAAGNLVNGFGDGGGTTTLGVSGANAGFDLSVDGSRLVLAGRSLGITYDPAIAVFNADGTPDTSFDGDGYRSYPISPSNGRFASVFVTPDGIVAAGQGSSGVDQDFLLMRVSRTTGSPDPTFGGGDGTVFTNIGLDSDGATDTTLVGDTVSLGGWADQGGGFAEAAFARYDLT